MHLFFLLFTFLIEIHAENDPVEFVPIGKDSSSVTLVPIEKKPIENTIISHKVFKEDGIKYTEIVRQTPSGGTQTAHIKGNVKPSILPVPVPNLSGLMNRVQTRLITRMEVSSPQNREIYTPDTSSFERADGLIYRRPTEFDPIENHGYPPPPPPYPPMMMYPPTSDSLMGRVESMTGNILDNVMTFVMGRRRI